eukprot:187610-Prymnesium_polylepis.1
MAKRLAGTGMEHERYKLGERMEELAVGMIRETDTETAYSILRESGTAQPNQKIIGNRNCIDLAATLGRKKFVEASHCQGMVDRWWRGEFQGQMVTGATVGLYALPPTFGYVSVLFDALLPFFNRKLYAPLWGQEEELTTALQIGTKNSMFPS